VSAIALIGSICGVETCVDDFGEYIRRGEKVNEKLKNVEFETIPMVKDPSKVINHQQWRAIEDPGELPASEAKITTRFCRNDSRRKEAAFSMLQFRCGFIPLRAVAGI
jgi:hypothetical protein